MKNRRVRRAARLRGDSAQRRRMAAAALLLGAAAFVPILVQLGCLMVGSYDRYAALALRNQTRSTTVTADRGTIYDRNMNILACSRGVETVYLDPHELRQSGADLQKLADTLGALLELEPEKILAKAKKTNLRYQKIADGIDRETGRKIRHYLNQQHLAGVHLEPGSRRFYPGGPLAAQVIGFTDASNAGVEGIEASYNGFLSGHPGSVMTTKGNNEMDLPFSVERFLTAQKGADVILTLDTTVQACLEKQMRAAIDRYQVKNGAFGMVMEADTGAVLAMATLGSYDPNQYLQVQDPQAAEQLRSFYQQMIRLPEGTPAREQAQNTYRQILTAARLKQWRNRCISDGYEPGSTFKTITMAAALDCGAIDLNTRFHCGGTEQIPGRAQLLHCWKHAGHGAIDTAQALQNSCNIAFAHIALKLGGERFYDYMERFGIREKTGIDLRGESSGIFFDRSLITDTDKWGTASLTSGSFGQTFKITPMQLVRAVAAVVNGGRLLEPYLVSEVVDSQGKTLLRQEPTVIRQVIRPQTSAAMCRLIESVVTGGTAKNAAVPGFSIGGKTGTSEKIDVFDDNGQRVQDKIVSFIGIAPMDHPQYIVLVALDTPSRETGIYISGGVMAAPTVGAVMEEILPYLEVPRRYEPGEAAQCLVTMPDLEGMDEKEAKKTLQEAGLTGSAVGEGLTVLDQIPEAGALLPGGSEVLLYLQGAAEEEKTLVPDFLGSNRLQAQQKADRAGLYILVKGNPAADPAVTAAAQSASPGRRVARGSTITITFTDGRASD